MSDPLRLDELDGGIEEAWYWEEDTHDIEPPDWLIDMTLPERSVNMLFGEFNLGKTFLALDWAACVAGGIPWLGHEVKQRDVLYIASEGDPGGLGKRMEAWRERWRKEGVPLRILFYADMVNVKDMYMLLDAARDRGLRPGLVIVDTLAMAMDGEENSNTEMTQVVKDLRKLQHYTADGEEYQVTFLLVHHTGWEKGRPRGGSGMPGGLDYVLGMAPDEKVPGSIKLWMYKAKRSDKHEWGTKHLRIKPMTSDAVIESVAADEYKVARIEATQTAGFLALRDYLLETGETTVRQVDVRKWYAKREGEDPDAFKGSISKAFKQAKKYDLAVEALEEGRGAIRVTSNPALWSAAETPEDI